MFDFFRNHLKIMMGLLLLLIIPSFVFFGIDNYTRFRQGVDVVAEAGDVRITRQEWDAVHRNEVDRIASSAPGIDRRLLDSEAARLATLERMLNEQLVILAARDGHVSVSDQRLARALHDNPDIAALYRADGRLDVAAYQDWLRARGLNAEAFEQSVRNGLVQQQITDTVSQSSFLPAAVADATLATLFQRREVQWLRVTPDEFRSSVTVTDADIEAYYQAQSSRFQTPEQVDVEYVVLDLDTVASRITLPEADVRAYYEQNLAQQAQQAQRRARHILLSLPDKATPEQKAAVKAQADALREELSQHPERFADLARQRSQDPSSAARGGDLDFISRGMMVKPFEDAVFALAKGQLSEVVETEFGYHLIQVTDIRTPATESFEAARPRLEADVRRQMAQKRFAEAAEAFSNTVYEQSDSFEPVASSLGLKVQRYTGLQRELAPTAAVLANARLRQAIFSADSLSQKHNSEAVETAPNQLVSARVLAHRKAETRPLTEVRDEVKRLLVEQRALEAARQAGQQRLEQWQKGQGAAPFKPAVLVSRTSVADLPPALMARVMAVPVTEGQPSWTGIDLGAQGFAVARVNRVLPREAAGAERAQQEQEQLSRLQAQAEVAAYLKQLRTRYQARILDNAKRSSSNPS